MKIIHLCDYIQPKLGYQEYYLAKEHAKMGHNVTVITSDRYAPFPDYKNTVEKILGPRIIGPKTEHLDEFEIIRLRTPFELGTRVWLSGLKKEIEKIKPDLVISHGMHDFNAIRASLYKKKLGYKLIIDDHSHMSQEKKGLVGFIYYKIFRILPNKIILKCADKLVATTPDVLEYLTKLYKLPKEKIEIIPLAADSEKFKYNKNLSNNFRKKHNISEKNVVITYTGKINKLKGPHNIFLAMDKIKDKLKYPVTLLFVGNIDKEYKDIFTNNKKKFNSKKITAIQIPAVSNSELVSVYSATDIAVWPRQASLSMIEAMSCDVPIICCDFLSERCKNNNGIAVKEDDIIELSEALKELINNKKKRKEFGKNARELVDKEYSWKFAANQFLK